MAKLPDAPASAPLRPDTSSAPKTPAENGRIPSLDGLRAVSIGLVLLSHATMGPPLNSGPGAILSQGALGVSVFFVISGFLITGLLLREMDTTGTISLRRFYLRRTLRIFPAYYVFIGVMALLAWLGVLHFAPENLVAAATYTANYCFGCQSRDAWFLGHTWSLSVEEQFYLLWPLLLVVAGRRRGGIIAAAWLLVAPLLRLHWLASGGDTFLTRFELVSDAIATGCLLAIHRPLLHASPAYVRFRDRVGIWSAVVAFGAAALAVHPSVLPSRLYVLVAPTVEYLAIALFLDHVVAGPSTVVSRALNRPIMIWIGGLSYSLYLWQQFFITAAWAPMYLSLPAIVLVAYASWTLVERPALAFRARIEPLILPRPRARERDAARLPRGDEKAA
ncbi:MAG TPA: acyltransferase [Gemmatimonadaceae bacterium]